MAFLPQNQRDQIMVFVVIVAVAAMGVFYRYVWSPKQEQLAALEARVERLTELNEKIEREVKRGNLAKLKAEGQRYKRDLAVLRQLVPTVNEVPGLLEQISTAARRVGLDLSDVQPEDVARGVHFDVHRYRLGVNGDYHAIARFLTNVGSLTRIVAPINLQLAPSSKALSRVLPKEHRLLEARFQVQTYVAHTGGTPQ
ncbi:MAG: type 4a pilus biogenesis protein PilO [Gemmatimonadaceae bacterium]